MEQHIAPENRKVNHRPENMDDDKNINLNPGGGIAHQEIHFYGDVHQVNTAATEVNNIYHVYGKEVKIAGEDPVVDKATVKKEILKDVSRLLGMVRAEKKPVFINLWNDIIDLKEVRYDIYSPGKNKDKLYKRSLVAGIIHFIGSDENHCLGWFDDYNASEIARTLLGSSEKSIRGELGAQPPAEVMDAIRELVNGKYS